MTPISLAMPAPIPADMLGTLVPAARFGIWSVFVVAMIVGLCAVLTVKTRPVHDAEQPIRLGADVERDAA